MAKIKKKTALIWKGDLLDALAFFELKCPDLHLELLVSFADLTPLPPSLLEAQAKSLEVPLLYETQSWTEWQTQWSDSLFKKLEKLGVEIVAFSHFKADAEFEKYLKKKGFKSRWPMKEWNPHLVRNAFFSMGHQAVIYESAESELVGGVLNPKLYEQRLSQKDGLNFRSFVFDGPFFQKKIAIALEAHESGKPTLVLKEDSKEKVN